MVVELMLDSRLNSVSRIRNLLIEHDRRYPGGTLSAKDIASILRLRTDSVRVALQRLWHMDLIRRDLVSVDPYRVKWGAKIISH